MTYEEPEIVEVVNVVGQLNRGSGNGYAYGIGRGNGPK